MLEGVSVVLDESELVEVSVLLGLVLVLVLVVEEVKVVLGDCDKLAGMLDAKLLVGCVMKARKSYRSHIRYHSCRILILCHRLHNH